MRLGFLRLSFLSGCLDAGGADPHLRCCTGLPFLPLRVPMCVPADLSRLFPFSAHDPRMASLLLLVFLAQVLSAGAFHFSRESTGTWGLGGWRYGGGGVGVECARQSPKLTKSLVAPGRPAQRTQRCSPSWSHRALGCRSGHLGSGGVIPDCKPWLVWEPTTHG